MIHVEVKGVLARTRTDNFREMLQQLFGEHSLVRTLLISKLIFANQRGSMRVVEFERQLMHGCSQMDDVNWEAVTAIWPMDDPPQQLRCRRPRQKLGRVPGAGSFPGITGVCLQLRQFASSNRPRLIGRQYTHRLTPLARRESRLYVAAEFLSAQLRQDCAADFNRVGQ